MRYQNTLLQYNDLFAKVYVYRPVAVWKEFTKSMPPSDLTYNRAVPVWAPSSAWTEAAGRRTETVCMVNGRF